MQYTGTIVKNVEKDAKVLLVGTNGTTYTNVHIKVDITGPATPKILATDSAGTQYDIAQLGYWGPEAGFPVQGTFTNTTPIKATFTAAGTYTVKLSLINVANANAVITSNTFNISVSDTETPTNNVTTNDENTINELPKTGISIEDYLILALPLIFIGTLVYLKIKRKN